MPCHGRIIQMLTDVITLRKTGPGGVVGPAVRHVRRRHGPLPSPQRLAVGAPRHRPVRRRGGRGLPPRLPASACAMQRAAPTLGPPPRSSAHDSPPQQCRAHCPPTRRSAHGFYPAILGPNNAAAKGRVPYALLAIMDALRLFPGQVGSRGGGASGRALLCGAERADRWHGTLLCTLHAPRLPPVPQAPFLSSTQMPPPPLPPSARPSRSRTWTPCCTPPTLRASRAPGRTRAAARRCQCWASRGQAPTATSHSPTTPSGATSTSTCRRVQGEPGGGREPS